MSEKVLGHAPVKPLFPWPPNNSLVKHPVDLDWNWEKLKIYYGRPKATDIIYFNFQTFDPDVVNWHLYHKVGCRVKTADQKNYRFGVHEPKHPDDPQLYIYIPHGSWSPPDKNDELAKDLALKILYRPEVYNIAFQWRGVTIKPGEIQRVGELIAVQKNIEVRYRSPIPLAPPDVKAVYNFDSNQMTLSITHASTVVAAAGIVHEATHAALDRQAKTLGVIAAEGTGFIAECLFAMNMGAKTRPPDSLRGSGWDVALAIRNGTDRTAADEALATAIYNNRTYFSQIVRGQHHAYNGFA